MNGFLVIQELERWFLRRLNANMAPKANLALVSEDPGVLRRFGIKITEYLNQVDEPENGGWFLFDDELIALMGNSRRSGSRIGEEVDHGEVYDDAFEHLISNGGAVIVCSTVPRRPQVEQWDVRVLLTGFEEREEDRPKSLEGRGEIDLDCFHAAVNAGRLPGRMVVCLVGDAVLEWSYHQDEGGLQ